MTDIAHLRGLLEGATEALAKVHACEPGTPQWNSAVNRSNAAHNFLADATKNALPALLDEIESLRAALARIAELDSDGLPTYTPQAMCHIARAALDETGDA